MAVGLVGTSYSANPNWNFVGALKEALHSDVVNYAEDGHGAGLRGESRTTDGARAQAARTATLPSSSTTAACRKPLPCSIAP